MKRFGYLVLVLMLLVSLAAVCGDKPAVEKGKYKSLEITQFTVKPGVGFPQDYMSKMLADMVNEIQAKHKFTQVYGADNKPSPITGPTLRLEGEVIEYHAGNQAMRYMVGFGAGKTKIVAHVKFTDTTTNEVMFEDDVDGKVIMGLLGGSSPGATRGLAKEVAGKAEKKFF